MSFPMLKSHSTAALEAVASREFLKGGTKKALGGGGVINVFCFAKYDAFCSHIFDYACLRRKAYCYRRDSKF